MLLDLKLLLDHDISNCKSSKQILKVKNVKQTYCEAIKGIRHEVKIELVKQLVIKKNSKVDMAEMMNIAHKHKEKQKNSPVSCACDPCRACAAVVRWTVEAGACARPAHATLSHPTRLGYTV